MSQTDPRESTGTPHSAEGSMHSGGDRGAIVLSGGTETTTPVAEGLSLLVSLQEIDREVLALRVLKDELPAKVAAVRDRLDQAEAEQAAARGALDQMVRDRRDREAKLEETKAHIARLKNRTGEIKTNTAYFAHLKEIEAAEKQRTAVEDEILGLMEKVETAEKDLSALNARVTEEIAGFEGRRRELELEYAHVDGEIDEKTKAREKLAAALDPLLLSRYEMVRVQMRGTAVVPARNATCTGCRMRLPPQLFNQVREGRSIIDCPHCHRILYWNPSA